MKDKNNALNDYKEVIYRSWTYRKLTIEEKERLDETLKHPSIKGCLKGDYYQRMDIMRAVYTAFLYGGFSSDNIEHFERLIEQHEIECDNIEKREIPLF